MSSTPNYGGAINATTETLQTFENESVALPWDPPTFDVSVSNILLAITLTLLDVVTIFGNLLVLLAFVIEKRLMQPFNMYILNLAVTDFSVAVTAMTFYTLDTLLGYWPFGTVMCGVWIYFDFAMTFSSVFTLVAISVDRLYCVTWAIHYKMHNNKRKTAIVLGLVWFCVAAIWTPPFIGDRMKHNEPHSCIWEPSDNREFVIFVAVIGHYIPCIVMVFCYIKVFMVMRRQSTLIAVAKSENPSSTAQVNVQPVQSVNQTQGVSSIGPSGHCHVYIGESQISNDQLQTSNVNGAATRSQYLSATIGHSNSQSSPPSRPPSVADNNVSRTVTTRQPTRSNRTWNNQQRERRIFITLTYILSSYLICWFPFYIAFDTYAWKPDLVPAGLYSFFFWSTYVNSTLNPFIYAYTNKEFRTAFIKVLKLMYKCSKT